jgi:hypothetical protein
MYDLVNGITRKTIILSGTIIDMVGTCSSSEDVIEKRFYTFTRIAC